MKGEEENRAIQKQNENYCSPETFSNLEKSAFWQVTLQQIQWKHLKNAWYPLNYRGWPIKYISIHCSRTPSFSIDPVLQDKFEDEVWDFLFYFVWISSYTDRTWDAFYQFLKNIINLSSKSICIKQKIVSRESNSTACHQITWMTGLG